MSMYQKSNTSIAQAWNTISLILKIMDLSIKLICQLTHTHMKVKCTTFVTLKEKLILNMDMNTFTMEPLQFL